MQTNRIPKEPGISRFDCGALIVAGVFWVFAAVYLVIVSPVQKIERENLATVHRFKIWSRYLINSPGVAFEDSFLEKTWHGDNRHPSPPVILMAWAGKIPENTMARMRCVPIAFGLLAMLVLFAWGRRAMGLRNAVWTVALIMVCPHVVQRSSSLSTGSSVAALWMLLLWLLCSYGRSVKNALVTGIFWGVALGTKITLLLAPFCYIAAEKGLTWRVPQKREGLSRNRWFWIVFWAVGVATFVLLWPWLWRNPIGRTAQHWAANRIQQDCSILWLGIEFERPPAFYPLWFILTTTPLPVLLLATVGGWALLHGRSGRLFEQCGADGLLWMTLHGITLILFLSLFVLPVHSALNGAEYFLPALFSVGVFASIGLDLLPSEVRISRKTKPIAIRPLVLIGILASVALGLWLAPDLGHYRNLVGCLLGEPHATAFSR